MKGVRDLPIWGCRFSPLLGEGPRSRGVVWTLHAWLLCQPSSHPTKRGWGVRAAHGGPESLGDVAQSSFSHPAGLGDSEPWRKALRGGMGGCGPDAALAGPLLCSPTARAPAGSRHAGTLGYLVLITQGVNTRGQETLGPSQPQPMGGRQVQLRSHHEIIFSAQNQAG